MAKNPISELYESIALLQGSVSWTWTHESAPFCALVTICLPNHPAPLSFSGAGQPSKQEAKASAALHALSAHLRAQVKPTHTTPAQDCISLLTSFCARNSITITNVSDARIVSATPAKLYGFRATLSLPNGTEYDDWFFAETSYTSISLAKREAAKRALKHLLQHPSYRSALLPLYNALPASERAAPHATPASLPELMSPQQFGDRFRAADSTPLIEGRHLEYKGSENPQWSLYQATYLSPAANRLGLSVAAYMTSYLNTGIAGRLVLGVSDAGVVQGIPMTLDDVDSLSKRWADMQGRIWPPVRHDAGLLPGALLTPPPSCPSPPRHLCCEFASLSLTQRTRAACDPRHLLARFAAAAAAHGAVSRRVRGAPGARRAHALLCGAQPVGRLQEGRGNAHADPRRRTHRDDRACSQGRRNNRRVTVTCLLTAKTLKLNSQQRRDSTKTPLFQGAITGIRRGKRETRDSTPYFLKT